MRKIIKENKLLFDQLKSGYSKFIPNITPKLEVYPSSDLDIPKLYIMLCLILK